MTSFLFLANIEKIKKKLGYVLNTFENIMENGASALKDNIFKYMISQRRQKVWSNGFKAHANLHKFSVKLQIFSYPLVLTFVSLSRGF